MPFFSVLIPSYNRPELIGSAVQSVLDSDFTDFEIIISDDKSPRQAEIAEVLTSFAHRSNIRVHLQTENLGEAANRDFLLHTARGEWQIILCDDDKLYPQALSALARAVREYPDAGIYAFGYTIIDEKDRISYSRSAPKALRVSVASPRLVMALLVSDTFPFWLYHPATFCSHRTVRERIKSNPNVGIGDDLMFLMDFINGGGVLQILPATLMYYRKISAANSTLQANQSSGELLNLISRGRILQHLRSRDDLRPVIAAFVAQPAYHRRLLFDPIVWSGVPLSKLLPKLQLPFELEQELAAYVHCRPLKVYKPLLTLRRAIFFVSLFGFAGLRELASVHLSRANSTHGN